MGAGKYKHLVKIQARVESQGTDGHPNETWTTITNGTVWANIRPVSGREQITGQQVNAEVKTVITIRYSSDVAGVTSKHRVLWGTRVYAIKEPPINIGERNREITLMCAEGIEDNG